MDEYWTPSAGQSEFNYSGDSSAVSGSGLGVDDPISTILQVAADNNAWSAEQASIQRRWQEVQNQKAMNFNSAEAEKNRAWQEYMSNTAHLREIKDLQAAGLNPVLSATGGNGAPVTSGASAQGVTSAGAKGDTDESSTGAVLSWLVNMLQAQTSILNTSVSAQAGMANAAMMAGATSYAAQMAAQASMYSADQTLLNHREQRDYDANHPSNPYEAAIYAGNQLGKAATSSNGRRVFDAFLEWAGLPPLPNARSVSAHSTSSKRGTSR